MGLRPCTCDRVTTGKFYIASDCIHCWSYYFEPYWARRWGNFELRRPDFPLLEDKNPDFDKGIIEEIVQKENHNVWIKNNLDPKIARRLSIDCVYIGRVISRANCNCPLKFVHNCDKYEKCVRGPQMEPAITSCLTCPDYEPDGN